MTESSIRVMVVDDEEMVRLSLTDFLEDEGFIVYSASKDTEVMEILEESSVDVAIIDMRLPGVDGNALIQKVNDIRPEMKFLIHTGTTDYSLPISLKDMGIKREHVFKKPLMDMNIIVDAIKSVVV
jgi:two-component system, OmpR family, response regulator